MDSLVECGFVIKKGGDKYSKKSKVYLHCNTLSFFFYENIRKTGIYTCLKKKKAAQWAAFFMNTSLDVVLLFLDHRDIHQK